MTEHDNPEDFDTLDNFANFSRENQLRIIGAIQRIAIRNGCDVEELLQHLNESVNPPQE
ncbi:MAG: hypothetical protein WDZ51_16405 [Pirellulaceae bacterium]